MLAGIFGTRADLFMDAAIALLTLLPLLMLGAFRHARARRFVAHRNLQVATLALVVVVVVLLELDIRISGGTAQFLARMPARATVLRPLLRAHVALASITLLAWLGLAYASWPRLGRSLPGSFSRRHRQLGLCVFVGASLLSASGAAMYALLFVL